MTIQEIPSHKNNMLSTGYHSISSEVKGHGCYHGELKNGGKWWGDVHRIRYSHFIHYNKSSVTQVDSKIVSIPTIVTLLRVYVVYKKMSEYDQCNRQGVRVDSSLE